MTRDEVRASKQALDDRYRAVGLAIALREDLSPAVVTEWRECLATWDLLFRNPEPEGGDELTSVAMLVRTAGEVIATWEKRIGVAP